LPNLLFLQTCGSYFSGVITEERRFGPHKLFIPTGDDDKLSPCDITADYY